VCAAVNPFASCLVKTLKKRVEPVKEQQMEGTSPLWMRRRYSVAPAEESGV